MQSIRLVLACSVAAGLVAQTPAPKSYSPYTATLVTEATFIATDASQSHQTLTVKIARDSSGRIWREQQLPAAGPLTGGSEVIFIDDHVAKVSYTLYPDRREGVRRVYLESAQMPFNLSLSLPGGGWVTMPGDAPLQPPRHEDLGDKSIDGILAHGDRTTMVVPAGTRTADGGALKEAITTVAETWQSRELGTFVSSIRSDSRYGRVVMRIADFKAGEPPASLFDVSHYTLQNAGADRDTRAALFQQAKDALAALPLDVAPGEMLQIASDEGQSQSFKDQSRADVAAAFQQALALPLDDEHNPSNRSVKLEVENGAVSELLAGPVGDDASLRLAVAFARQADVEKNFLYDGIIGHFAHLDAAALAKVAPLTAISLAHECFQSGGSYPYLGLAQVLQYGALSKDEKLTILHEGYAAATLHAQPSFDLESFSRVGHTAAPELDGELEPAIVASLSDPRFGVDQQLLALLSQIDSAKAAQIVAEHPSKMPPRPSPQSNPLTQISNLARSDPAGALTQALALTNPVQKLSVLANLAQFSAGRDPAAAQQAAAAALPLVGDAMASANPNGLLSAGNLSLALERLGRHDEALDLIRKVVAEADRRIAASQDYYDHRKNTGRPFDVHFLPSGLTSPMVLLQMYRNAAQLDFPFAVEHSEAMDSALFKPLVLAEIAAWGR